MENRISAAQWAASTAQKFRVPADLVQKGTQLFVKQLNDGLARDGASLLQVPSYVVKLPDGSEKGICLAIDLGGTNLRVISVELHGDSTYSLVQSKATIPTELMTAPTYKHLFQFIARHTESFMLENLPGKVEEWREMVSGGEVSDQDRRSRLHALGFTFSFTFSQHAIDKGTLMYWTKSFSIEDAVGRDPCAMLQEALDERQLPLLVTALANDTVGTLAARAYSSPPGTSQTLLAAIFGTGTNGAYMERMDRITKLHGASQDSPKTQPHAFMALNTEWGGFDRDVSILPVTEFDDQLDLASANPRDQYYEKRISGLYLGEILRRVLLADLHSDSPFLTFRKPPPSSRLYIPYSIDSSFLSELVSDRSSELDAARVLISRTLDTDAVSLDDAEAVQTVAAAIGKRAARLSAIAIAGVVIQSGRLEACAAPPSEQESFWRQVMGGLLKPLRCLLLFCGGQEAKSLWTHPQEKEDESISSGSASEKDSSPPGDMIDIGVDGSLFEHYPGFEENIRIALREVPEVGFLGEQRIRMSLAPDGSGIGAALIAWSSSNRDSASS